MEMRDEIKKELLEIAPALLKATQKQSFAVPEGYFEAFSSRVLKQVQAESAQSELGPVAPLLAGLNKQATAQAPSSYFTSFSTGLLEKIRATEVVDELRAIAPTLSGIERVNPYRAPEGYFNTFAGQVLKHAATPAPAPTPMPEWVTALNRILDQWVAAVFKPRYTFAFAGSATMVIVAAMLFMKTETTVACPPADPFCQLQQVSNDELNAYFVTHADEFGKSVLDVSTDDTRLKKRNANGELSIENYLMENISDEELSRALLN